MRLEGKQGSGVPRCLEMGSDDLRKLWTQSPSPPFQSNTNNLTASLFSFRFPKLGALRDLNAYQIQISPFKDEKTKAQGHTVNGKAKTSLDFSPGLFPVNPYRVLSTIPFRVFLPSVTPPSPSQPPQSPISTFLPQIRKARCPSPAHCGRDSLHVLPSQPPTHPIPSFSSIPGYAAPPPLLPPKLHPLPSPIPLPGTGARRSGRPRLSLSPTSLGGCTHAAAPLTGKAA